MKKYLYSIVLATLILFSTTAVKASNEVYYTNNKNIEMTEREYNNLLGLGFSEKQIEKMDQELFLENKDLEGTVLDETEKFIKITTAMRNGNKRVTTEEITEEEAEELQSQIPNRGPAPGNYYDGVTSSTVVAQVTKIIGVSNSYMRYMTTTTWKIMPPTSERFYDIIGLGLESNKVQMYGSIVFRKDWTEGGVDYSATGCWPKYTNTGGLAIYELPTGSITALEAMMYYTVTKQPNVGTITTLYAGGNFAHAMSSIAPTTLLNHIDTSYSTGVIVDSTYSSYFINDYVAIASFVGTW